MVLLQFAATWPLPRVPQKHFPASRYKYYIMQFNTAQQTNNHKILASPSDPQDRIYIQPLRKTPRARRLPYLQTLETETGTAM